VSGTSLEPGTVVLADQGGRLALSNDGGLSFEMIPMQRHMPITSITDAGAGRLAVTGPFGAMVAGRRPQVTTMAAPPTSKRCGRPRPEGLRPEVRQTGSSA